jgi:hypothetical protein
MRFKTFLILLMLALIPVKVRAQNIQQFPRMNLTFNGSATAETLNLGGWTRLRLMTFAPPISLTGEARWYFDGTNIRISENGGAYRIIGAGNGTVTSVGLSSPGVIFSVSGSPVTNTGTLALGLLTQAANTALRGPATGAAATPTFRTMVSADIPNGIITFPQWASNGCADGQIPKYTVATTSWGCAADLTTPGGTGWFTTGNTLGAAGAKLGSLDAFAYDIVGNNVSLATVSTNANITFHNITQSDATTTHGFQTTSTSSGFYGGYFKMGQRTAITSGPGLPGASESVFYMDSADGHVYLKEGTAAAFRVGSFAGAIQTYVQWTAKQATQPTAAFASFDIRNDHPVIAFSDGVTEAALWEGVIPEQWDGTTLEVQFAWTGGAAITGNVRWECAMERNDTATDIDADSFGTVVLVTTTTGTTAGQPRYTTCSMSTAAIRDNVLAGEAFRLRIRRIGADAADTMTADAQIMTVQVRHP